jgi:hypothetical protein
MRLDCDFMPSSGLLYIRRSERSSPLSSISATGFHSVHLSECGGAQRSKSLTPLHSGLLLSCAECWEVENRGVRSSLRPLRYFHLPILPALFAHDPHSDTLLQEISCGLRTFALEPLGVFEPECIWQSAVRLFPFQIE